MTESNLELKYDEKYYISLDLIREMGVCNMWAASEPLRDIYPEMSRKEAGEVLGEWMRTFSDRHPEGCDCGRC